MAGDSAAAVARTAEMLESLGVAARSADGILDILSEVTSRWPVDVLVFDLACDAWIYVTVLEVLVRERRRVRDLAPKGLPPWSGSTRPLILVISDQHQSLLDRVRGLDLPVLVRPFERDALESALSALPEEGLWRQRRSGGR